MLGVDVDSDLVQGGFGVFADFVPFFGDDRDLADLVQQGLSELVDLGRGRRAAGEDAEVDADFEPGRLGLAAIEGELGFRIHRNAYCPPVRNLTFLWLPSKPARRDDRSNQ